MARNIILFSDGTGNSSNKLFKTNVWRLYQALDFSDPESTGHSANKQIARYDNGVGTSSFTPFALLARAVGWGLERNVINLYTFLCTTYQPGDRIYCFGFSRGAYTIMVLTGLINSEGLLNANKSDKLAREARAAFKRYRSSRKKGLRKWLSTSLFSNKPSQKNIPQITFLGLWDTVAAHGLPFQELTQTYKRLFPISNLNRDLPENVKQACHALALDDERKSFHPVLWNESNLSHQNTTTMNIKGEKVAQVWFSGSHSNVGGGYPDDGLSYVSLSWMMDQAKMAGLRFKAGSLETIKATANYTGKFYDSRQGFGNLYRYLPRKLAVLTKDIHDSSSLVNIPCPKIHESVMHRIQAAIDRYAPLGLPMRYAIVKENGEIVDSKSSQLHTSPILEHPTQAENRSNLQEYVWNLSWWKCIAHLAYMILIYLIVIFPFYRLGTNNTCEGKFCALSPLFEWITWFLPDIMDLWSNAFTSHPGTIGGLIILTVCLYYCTENLQNRIHNKMYRIWTPIIENPRTPILNIAPLPKNLIFRLRSSLWYSKTSRITTMITLSYIFIVWVFVPMIQGVAHVLFTTIDSGGLVCLESKTVKTLSHNQIVGFFSPRDVCWASGVQLSEGKNYQIRIEITSTLHWTDASINTGLAGFNWPKMTAPMYAAVLLKRHIREPWFKPIARIGSTGTDEYPLNPIDQSIPDQLMTTLVAEITARRSGELFLFVNDAALPVPKAWQWFYNNNNGRAVVSVTPISYICRPRDCRN